MYKRQTERFFGVLVATLLVVGHAAAQEQLGSAFTYQGGLKLSGQAVNDTADFEFTLWDADANGNMIGSLWPVNNVNVVDGLFTALLDFGVEPYTTNEARWLEIAVRSPSGQGNFTTLDPRQRLTPAPFSLATRGISVDANGNVGIGTTSPNAHLDVRATADGDGGTIRAARRGGRQWIELRDNNHLGGFITGRSVIENKKPLRVQNVFGGSGEPSGSTDIVFQVGDEAAPTEAMRILENGNVGIGTTDSGAKLEVNGDIKSPPTGTLWFNDANASGDPGSDGFRIRYVSNFFGETSDAFVIEKTDANQNDPDGGIAFANTGTDGVVEAAMVIRGNGDVGIGTRTPAAKLHVGGVPGVDGIMFPDGTLQTTASQGGGEEFWASNGAHIYKTNSGNVGIGTSSPAYPLHVFTGAAERAVFGENTASSGRAYGLYGTSRSTSTFSAGVFGSSTASSGETYGGHFVSESNDGVGVFAEATDLTGPNFGVYARSNSSRGIAVFAEATDLTGPNFGVFARSDSERGVGVFGDANDNFGVTYGVRGRAGSNGYAVYSDGNLFVSGFFRGTGGKNFQIDHPLDPANKYLLHYCAEGPEPLLIYRGNAILDESGEAQVALPDYFEEINRDFQYQLTPIGAPSPNLYIAEKIAENQFKIAGGQSFSEVSWTVTGVRNDRFMQRYGTPVEEEKRAEHRGKYLSPELYGQPKEMGVHYIPEMKHYAVNETAGIPGDVADQTDSDPR